MQKIHAQAAIGSQSLSGSRKWIRGEYNTHWHEFYEIEYILSGDGAYTLNGEKRAFEAGMLFFVSPADFHSVDTPGAEIINLMFRPELASPGCLVPLTTGVEAKCICLIPRDRELVEALLEEILRHQEDGSYHAALLDCLLMKLSRCLELPPEGKIGSAARKMEFFILNHFRERITLADAAAYVGLTPSYASAVFKKEMGVNFKAALNSLRFDYAKKLLRWSDMTVAQICGESGFEDYPNFIRRFKERFGLPPARLRRDAGESGAAGA